MARLPKCPVCEYQVDKETQKHVKHSGKTYHENCFQKFEMQKQHRIDLHAYICELYRIPTVNGYMLKQIKEFQETYKFTLKGIELALRFFHDINGNQISDGNDYKTRGIGIVPFVYEDAKTHYILMDNIRKKASESGFESKEEVIYMKQPTKKTRKDYIDIEGLLNE